MSNSDLASKFILTTDFDTNKNTSSETYTFTSNAVTLAAGTYDLDSFSVPLDSITSIYQIYINISLEGNTYFVAPAKQYNSGTYIIAPVISSDGLEVYIVNITGGSVNVPSFTTNVKVRQFETLF